MPFRCYELRQGFLSECRKSVPASKLQFVHDSKRQRSVNSDATSLQSLYRVRHHVADYLLLTLLWNVLQTGVLILYLSCSWLDDPNFLLLMATKCRPGTRLLTLCALRGNPFILLSRRMRNASLYHCLSLFFALIALRNDCSQSSSTDEQSRASGRTRT